MMAADEAHVQVTPQKNIKVLTTGLRVANQKRNVVFGEFAVFTTPIGPQFSHGDWETANDIEMCLIF
jgi:hypothetical protein